VTTVVTELLDGQEGRMCQAGYNVGEGGSVTKTREVKITHMCGLNYLAVWESDVKWEFCLAFIGYGYIG
jgi:hypothetical protein